MRHNAVRLGRLLYIVVCLVTWGGTAAAAAETGQGDFGAPILFDIPAQPLISALDAFSAATGLEVLYDSSLAINRRSTGVKGVYSTKTALSLLLEGSGLVVRSISAEAITIMLRPAGQRAASKPRPGADPHRAYFAMIQTSFEAAFCKGKGDMDWGRVILRFRIGPSGAIEQPEVLDSPENGYRRQMIVDMLRHVTLADSPPKDMPQPIIMLIRPSAQGNIRCPTSN